MMVKPPAEETGRASWIASLMKQLLEEVRVAPLGMAARTRVAEMKDRSFSEPEQGLAMDVVNELNGNPLSFAEEQPPDIDSGVGQTRGLSRRTRRLSRVDRVRLSRVDRLLRNIETAQIGQEMAAHRDENPRRSPTALRRPVPMQKAPPQKAPPQKTPMREAAIEKTPMEKACIERASVAQVPMTTGDFISDFIRLPRSSSPAGSVSLDVACDLHGGRLMRLWMAHEASGSTVFGGEGRNDVWDTDTQGRGAVIVRCTRPGCQGSARLTNDWLEARLLHVRADYEAGQGLPIAQIPLSQVGVY
jgi:hypothetical protein